MKVLPCPEQKKKPWTNSEEELVRHDVEYLVECLGKLRGTCYHILAQPDVEKRQSPQPDYLVKDSMNNSVIAIEHARFFESQEARKNEANWVRRVVNAGGIPMRWLTFPRDQEVGERLSQFFDEKLGKGQFIEYSHAERILLARNRWSEVRICRFLKAEPYFNPQRRSDCDHFYLIVQRKLIEVF